MAIKVGGTIVVDDSRNICNVGTVNATSFSGSGANLTGLPSSGVTSVTGTAPVSSSGGTTPVLSMAAATAGVNGYMTSTYASKLDGIASGATNVTNTNQLANGSGYITSAPAPSAADGASFALIQCICATNATSVELSAFSSTYDTYMLQASNIIMSYCYYGMHLTMRWYICGTYTGVNSYDFNNSATSIGTPTYSGGQSGSCCSTIFTCTIGCMPFHPAASTTYFYGFNCATSAKSMMGLNSATVGGPSAITGVTYYAGNNGAGRSGTVTRVCFDSCNWCSCPLSGLFKLYGIK